MNVLFMTRNVRVAYRPPDLILCSCMIIIFNILYLILRMIYEHLSSWLSYRTFSIAIKLPITSIL
jgi:hypothetical protein